MFSHVIVNGRTRIGTQIDWLLTTVYSDLIQDLFRT